MHRHHQVHVIGTIRRPATLALVLTALLGGCGGSDEVSPGAVVFAYNRSAPLGVQDAGRVNQDYPIAVRDISFAVPGGRAQAFLAVPPGAEGKPAVVYLHGQGGDRSELLVPATWLAARGAVTLALTAPSATTQRTQASGVDGLREERDLAVADVVAVRRALDVLGARPDVDAERLGFVGYSAGARTGAILAGVEPRLDALVLMSAGASPVAAYVDAAPAELKEDVEATLGEIDPLRYAALDGDRVVLLQIGRTDEVVPVEALDAIAEATAGAEVRRYDAGHSLNDDAYREHLEWLAGELGITGPPVAGAQTGP
jgi:dienelactone hydrolase